MKKAVLITLMALFIFQVSRSQVQKVETYHVGTKVTYYPNQCGNAIPEAEGKISFCDSQNNLGVVEASYGLNDVAINKMVPNYYNNDEVFITRNGISIRKTDGTWENIPNFAVPIRSLQDAVVHEDGKLFFIHKLSSGVETGLHYFDLKTKKFSSISYATVTGGINAEITISFAYDTIKNITYILTNWRGENGHKMYKYENNVLSFIANLPTSIAFHRTAKITLLFANDALFLGLASTQYQTGLYKLNKNSMVMEGSYFTDSAKYITEVHDIAVDANGDIWTANSKATALSEQDGAIYKIDKTTEEISTYQLASAANANIKYSFNSLDIDNNGKVWATVPYEDSRNLGFFTLEPNGSNPIWTVTLNSEMAALGFPIDTRVTKVYKFNNKIYLMDTNDTYSSVIGTNYEAIINDNGVWSGITDDEPNNISNRTLHRYEHAYPDANGVWFYNYYDGGIISHISDTDKVKKQFDVGSGSYTEPFILDADGHPVLSNGRVGDQKLVKFYMPYIANFQSHGRDVITQFQRYKDQIWLYSSSRVGKIFVYKQQQLIHTFDLGEDVYSNWSKFTPDIQGNAFFARRNYGIELRKYDTSTRTTTTYANTTDVGVIRKLIPLPNGNVAVICTDGIYLFNGTTLTAIGRDAFSELYNIRTGVSDVNGKIWLLTNDPVKLIGIENPEAATPTFSSIQVSGTSGVVPSFYKPSAFAIDANGAFWMHASTTWMKLTTDNTAPQFLNEGATYGITGTVYLDRNENNKFDADEGYPKQKVTLKNASGGIYETYTNAEGSYYFPYYGGLGACEITLPVLSPYVVAPERHWKVRVTTLDADTKVTDIQLQDKDLESLLVKSSTKSGAWAFTRTGLENTFTTAIGNLSYSKTFNYVGLDYVFFNAHKNANNVLPAIKEVKITRLQPKQPFHIIDKLTIEPQSHKWKTNVAADTYTSSVMAIIPKITIVADTTKIAFALPQISPLDTYIIEVKTELFEPSNHGAVVGYGTSKVTSNNFNKMPENGYQFIPSNPEDGQGVPDLAGPYKTPKEIYDDESSIPEKEVYVERSNRVGIRSSYDPNDKLVNPGVPDAMNEIPLNERWLTYTIRFQNEGNFSAKDVFVVDTLDQKFDKHSLTLLESTHPMTVETIKSDDQNIVKFNFNDIYLDYKSNNEEASQGYLKYMIKANDDVAIDAVLENRAAIYFDQNPPIHTNLTQHKYVQITLDIDEFTEVENGIKFWPNPVSDYLNIKIKEGNAFRLKLYNLMGQEVQSIPDFKQSHQLDVSQLNSGFYVLKVNLENGKMQSIKFIKN